MSGTLNWVDYIIIAIFGFSILAGLMRGLVKEIVAVLTWIAAVIVSSLFATDLAAQFTGSSVSNTVNSMGANAAKSVSLLSVGISFVLIFIMVMIVGGVVNYFATRAVDAGGISIGNRLLGGVFGLVRGFIINTVLIFLVQLSPLAQQPLWKSSDFVNAFQPAVAWLANLVYPGIESLKSNYVMPTINNINLHSENAEGLVEQIYKTI